MTEKRFRNLLERSFDDSLTAAEKRRLENALAGSETLRRERDEWLQLRHDLARQKYAFKDGFKERLMARIEDEKKPLLLKPEFNRSLYSVFKRVALTGVAAILILLLSLYLSGESLSLDTVTGEGIHSDEDLVSILLYEDLR